MNNSWVTYIVECSDGSLYTGISNHLEQRLGCHNNGEGAKYTRSRRPVELRFYETHENRSCASQREAYIKACSRKQKIDLINSDINQLS